MENQILHNKMKRRRGLYFLIFLAAISAYYIHITEEKNIKYETIKQLLHRFKKDSSTNENPANFIDLDKDVDSIKTMLDLLPMVSAKNWDSADDAESADNSDFFGNPDVPKKAESSGNAESVDIVETADNYDQYDNIESDINDDNGDKKEFAKKAESVIGDADYLNNPVSSNKADAPSNSFNKTSSPISQIAPKVPEVVFMSILCTGYGKDLADTHLERTKVMLKSALMLTKTKLRFIYIVNTDKTFQDIVNLTSEWPTEIRSRITLEYVKTWYPPGTGHMKSWFRPCVTEKLFIPEMFPDLDAAIIIDDDIIFLGPPEELWNEFAKFNESQVIGMVRCGTRYNNPNGDNRVPFYGESGLNGGIVYMNFTRIKQLPGIGFMNETLKITKEYFDNIRLAEQDILNIFFHFKPHLLYEVGCQFNYRFSDCSFHGRKNICEYAGKHGAYVLHGNTGSFNGKHERKLGAVYDAFNEHPIDLPLKTLLSGVQEHLKRPYLPDQHSHCARTPGMDFILTNELSKHV